MIAGLLADLPALPLLTLAVGVVLLGGVLRGFVGFGGALIIIPVLATIFTPSEAVAMHLMMEIPGTLQLLPVAWRQSDKQAVSPTLMAIIIGTPLGAYLLANLDPQPMRIGISLMVLIIVGLLVRDWLYPGNVAQIFPLGVLPVRADEAVAEVGQCPMVIH